MVQNVSADLTSSLEAAIASAGASPEYISRKETKADGYPRMIKATSFKWVGATFLWCTASQMNDDGIPVFTETVQTLQTICGSVAPH